VVVRVEANGICRTDWHLWMGDWSWIGLQLPLPHVLGREFCGVIDEVGPGVTRWRKGDRVLVPFSVGEGSCEWCRSGHHNICDTMLTPGVVSWGGYGRRAGVPFADVNLVPLPESIGFVEAASMGCRYMTSFHGLVDQAKVGAGEWGRHLQIGLTTQAEQGEVALPIDLIVLKEATIIGSCGMQAPRFGAMLQMVEAGKLRPGKLVHKTIPLEEAGQVLASMDRFATVGVNVIDRYGS